VALSGAFMLVACGPPSGTSATDSPTTTPPPTAVVDPGLPPGRLDPGALSGFACGPDGSGVWTATGTLTNTGSDPADYVVTVVVAGPDSTAVRAKRQVVGLRSGASEPLAIDTLPLPAEGELSCQAQVLRRS
jgi:hypothetical protein